MDLITFWNRLARPSNNEQLVSQLKPHALPSNGVLCIERLLFETIYEKFWPVFVVHEPDRKGLSVDLLIISNEDANWYRCIYNHAACLMGTNVPNSGKQCLRISGNFSITEHMHNYQ